MADKVKSTGGSNLRQKRLNPFSIDYESPVDERQYKGKFISKKLSIRDLAALGVRKVQLNGGMHHDRDNPGHGVAEETDEFNNMIAHLELSILEAPKWWNLDEITDLELIARVYREVIAFENKFLGRRRGGNSGGDDSDGSGSSGGEGDPSESDDAGGDAEVVDEEVLTALEP